MSLRDVIGHMNSKGYMYQLLRMDHLHIFNHFFMPKEQPGTIYWALTQYSYFKDWCKKTKNQTNPAYLEDCAIAALN